MTGHDHDQAPAATTPEAAAAPAPASGPVALIRSMIAQGRHAPGLVADVIHAHPHECHAIVEVLHQTLGNAFVQKVMGVHPADHGESHPVTPADLRAVIGEHRDGPAEPVAADGLIAHRVREHAGYLHDTNDVTSVFPPELAAKYQACVDQAAAGVLVFPSPKDPPGKTSAPFVAFVKAFYKHFHADEKRINLDIIKHGGKKAFEMTPYLESLLVDVPSKYCAGRAQRVHRKAEAAFVAMHDAAARDGVSLKILSAYRPPAKNHAPSKNPFAKASNSSHNYGLAIDLQLSGEGLHVHECSTQDMTNTMKYYGSSVTKWMVANAAQFDFHPYAMEPWHYEYNPDGMAAEIVEGAKAFGAD